MEAYKLFKECHKEKVAFLEVAFAKGMDDTRRRVLDHYPRIDLRFLDEDVDGQVEGAPAIRAIGTLRPPTFT